MWLWLTAIAFLGIWAVMNREMKGGRLGGGNGGRGGEGLKGKFLRWTNFALFVVGSLSLLLAPLGSWGSIAAIMAQVMGAVLGWVGSVLLAGAPASALAFVLSLILLVAIVIDLWGWRPDKVARFGLIVLIPLCLVAGGSLGGLVVNLAESLTGSGASVLQQLANS